MFFGPIKRFNFHLGQLNEKNTTERLCVFEVTVSSCLQLHLPFFDYFSRFFSFLIFLSSRQFSFLRDSLARQCYIYAHLLILISSLSLFNIVIFSSLFYITISSFYRLIISKLTFYFTLTRKPAIIWKLSR